MLSRAYGFQSTLCSKGRLIEQWPWTVARYHLLRWRKAHTYHIIAVQQYITYAFVKGTRSQITHISIQMNDWHAILCVFYFYKTDETSWITIYNEYDIKTQHTVHVLVLSWCGLGVRMSRLLWLCLVDFNLYNLFYCYFILSTHLHGVYLCFYII